ncbi:hypothetical protein BC826DRAFT_966777 [Russula brevipes]|nr:hypothetical protein BC826DRAFT_966777 [Russula brevipes]
MFSSHFRRFLHEVDSSNSVHPLSSSSTQGTRGHAAGGQPRKRARVLANVSRLEMEPGSLGHAGGPQTSLPVESSPLDPLGTLVDDMSFPEHPTLDALDPIVPPSGAVGPDALEPHALAAPTPPLDVTTSAHNPSHIPPGDIEDLWDQGTIRLGDLKLAAQFIKALQVASLDDPTTGLSSDALARLRSPPHDRPSLSIDEDTRLAIDLFLENPSEASYEANRAIILHKEASR